MQIDIRTAVDLVGTPTKLALKLGLAKRQGGQRVSQWLRRKAIPLEAQLEFADEWRRIARRIARVNARKRAVA